MLPAGFTIVDNNMGILRLCFYWSEQKNNKLKLKPLILRSLPNIGIMQFFCTFSISVYRYKA